MSKKKGQYSTETVSEADKALLDSGLSEDDLDIVSSDANDDMVSVPKAQLDAMAKKQEELERTLAQVQANQVGGLARNQDAVSRIVTRKARDEFLTTTRPATEVFCWNPYAFFALYSGREETDHISGNKKKIPAFLIRNWQPWMGPGSEFPNEHFNQSNRTGPKIYMGRLLLHEHTLAHVTQSDIEEFNLPPGTRVKAGVEDVHNKPFYTVRKIVDMLMKREDLEIALYTGSTMQTIFAAMYEAHDAEMQHKEKMIQLVADVKSRSRLKTGQLGDVKELVEA